jgi:predicted dehydrogenase
VDDDDMQIAALPANGAPAPVERRAIASDWMDASHAGWFNAMFDEFLAAIASGDHAGREARDAYRCIEIIDAAYASSAEACRERALGAPLPAGISAGR